MNRMPHNIAELREFYFGEYAPLYDYLNARLERIPQELHFEASAALDHLMRIGKLESGFSFGGEDEAVAKAAGHLKRATFDAFKLLHKKVVRKTALRLCASRYADVDNGAFVPRVQELWHQSIRIAEKARGLERGGFSDDPDRWDAAFVEWRKLRDVLDELESMEQSPAARRARRRHARHVALYVLGMILSAVISFFVGKGLNAFFER